MKKILLLLTILFSINSFSQEIEYKTYSYTEFFQMIENEKDSVFTLENALIKPNEKTDALFFYEYPISKDEAKYEKFETSIQINKKIILKNVQFKSFSTDDYSRQPKFAKIKNIEFLQSVSLENVANLEVLKVIFNETLYITYTPKFKQNYTIFSTNQFNGIIMFDNCLFKDGINFVDLNSNEKTEVQFGITNSLIKQQKTLTRETDLWVYQSLFRINDFYRFNFYNNQLEIKGASTFFLNKVSNFDFSNNTFTDPVILFLESDNNSTTDIQNNNFKSNLLLGLENDLSASTFLDYNQFNNNLHSYYLNTYYFGLLGNNSSDYIQDSDRFSNRNINHYVNRVQIEDAFSHKKEINFKGRLYDFYKQQHDNEFANKVYIDIKDLETKRLAYLYKTSPSFDTFFTWKINQFLKVFSAYGTKPSKAVIFSLYVILLFAFVYLLFPNSWDKHGKNRIINRYKFFTKYMKKDAGIHEVYLEDAATELLEYEDFKNYMTTSGKSIPKFFLATSLQLYKWAISGTKFSAGILRRVDIMKGTWDEVPKKKRIWKSILLIGAFLIAVCYDVLIKMLNALMLSINTFTTLGFGEIPIKGLPRYLAIIQGFIGWFMLTIFSVSLISQLLN